MLGLLALGLAGPGRAEAPRPPRPDVPGLTEHLAERINTYRAEHGLAPLAWSADLTDLAAAHSREMAASRRLSHDGFRDRRAHTQSTLCVENVAHNFPTAETLLDGWRRSPGHHRNLLEPGVVRMGIATTARYVTFFACR